MSESFRHIFLNPNDFFTNPTDVKIDYEKIRQDCEAQSREITQKEMEAWSELGGQVVGAEVPRSH